MKKLNETPTSSNKIKKKTQDLVQGSELASFMNW